MSEIILRHMTFDRNATQDEVVTALRLRAARGVFDGIVRSAGMQYVQSCTADHLATGTRVMFTRDTGHHTSGWLKNPDYERCLHLSTSFREPDTGGRLPQRRRVSVSWAKLFFGDDLKLAWVEPPHSPEGIRCDVLHFRVFCDEHWRPLKPRGEVYSTEFTEVGWKSFGELGTDVQSSLYPG